MNSRLIVRTLPSDDELARLSEWVTAGELAAAAEFAPQRRREYLAWRAAVRQELGRDIAISYDANGAPKLGNGLYVSVSHSQNLVAVCIGDSPCAVDTEPLERNFDRVRKRYLSAEEAALSDDPRLAAAVWCAKEALYKLGGRNGCDFLRDIRVTAVDFSEGCIVGTIHGRGPTVLRMEIRGGDIIVWC